MWSPIGAETFLACEACPMKDAADRPIPRKRAEFAHVIEGHRLVVPESRKGCPPEIGYIEKTRMVVLRCSEHARAATGAPGTCRHPEHQEEQGKLL